MALRAKLELSRKIPFHFVLCERLVPFSDADLSGLDSEEIAYRLALAIAAASKRGFRLRDCGRGNWGFGLRNGRVVPLLLDGNSWTKLDPSDELYGRWPPKKLIGSFWPLLTEIHEQASTDISQQVYHPEEAKNSTQITSRTSSYGDYPDWILRRPGILLSERDGFHRPVYVSQYICLDIPFNFTIFGWFDISNKFFPLDGYGWQSYIYGAFWRIIFTIGISIITGSLHSAVFAAIWHYIDFYVSTSGLLCLAHSAQCATGEGSSNSISIIAEGSFRSHISSAGMVLTFCLGVVLAITISPDSFVLGVWIHLDKWFVLNLAFLWM